MKKDKSETADVPESPVLLHLKLFLGNFCNPAEKLLKFKANEEWWRELTKKRGLWIMYGLRGAEHSE